MDGFIGFQDGGLVPIGESVGLTADDMCDYAIPWDVDLLVPFGGCIPVDITPEGQRLLGELAERIREENEREDLL